MKAKKRIGVIGAGAIAQGCHIPGYAAAKNCQLVAVADPSRKCLQQVRQRGYEFERTYSDYRKMLDTEDLDAVSICTPNALHKEMAVACCRKGLTVLLEKPIALSLAEARAIARTAKAFNFRVMVGFSHRFYEHCVKVKRQMDAGAIGKPYMVRVRFAHTGPWPGWARTNWFYNPELAGGGAMLDMGIHAFDLVQWFVGPVTAVQATVGTLRKKIAVDDNAVVALEIGDRALGYVDVGWTSPAGFNGVELMGDKGAITIDYGAGTTTIVTGAVNPSGNFRLKPRTLARGVTKSHWQREMQYFTRMLGKDEPFEADLAAGIASLKVALAAYASSRSGRRVSIR